MDGSNLYTLCRDKEWPEMRKYLSSDAAEEEKKSNIMYHHGYGRTCLHRACRDAPDDIIKTMLDIGGKELVMKVDGFDGTVLHLACGYGASYNIIKMLIEVGGKDLIMAKSSAGYTALHHLCLYIEEHTKVAEKVKLILKVGDANLLLSTKNSRGEIPLEIATEEGASKRIKKLLTVQSTASVADMQMEPAHTQELLDRSNRRAADLEATVETQRSENADLSNEKDDIEKKCKYKVDKLMRIISKQQAELHLLNNSSSDVEVGMKRKHTNEEHEEGEGTVVQSQTQSSKRSKVGNAAGISSGSFIRNQAEDDDDDLVNMLMSRHMALRKELRSAKAQIVELKQEIDDLAI
eukprot:scaffold375_cov299-Chaetoceros_neogracile.AAC.14